MGRPKGSINRRSVTLLSELVALGVDVPSRIITLLNSERDPKEGGLNDRDKLHGYLELLQYIYPKRKSVEITTDPEKPIAHIVFDTQFGDGSTKTDA